MSSQKGNLARSAVSSPTHVQDERWGGKYQNEGTRTLSGWQWWLLVPKIPVNEHKELFFFFFLTIWDINRELCLGWVGCLFSVKYLSSCICADKNLPKCICFAVITNSNRFFSGSNKSRGLTDTINIAHVICIFYKDVFAYKCPLPFLYRVIFSHVIFSQIQLSLSSIQYTEEFTVSV